MTEVHCTDALPGFHLGASDESERMLVESHLLRCHSCLEAFFELKRRVDSAAVVEERPSPEIRARVRADVAERLGARTSPLRRRPVLSLAIAAAILVLLGLTWLQVRRISVVSSPRGNSSLIDTGSRVSAYPVL